MSQPRIQQAPIIQPAPIPPPPAAPVPDAPNPLYDKEIQDNLKASNSVSGARAGRAALKINLVNSGTDGSGSGVNTTN